MKKIALILMLLFTFCTVFAEDDKPVQTPAEEKAQLENKKKAKARALEDDKYYTSQERRELAELYMSWYKTKKVNEQKAIAQKFLRRYPKANAAGWVQLNLAHISPRQEEIKLLKQAIKDYNDCYYLNGVQVGALARSRLVKCLNRIGKKEEAEKYLRELKESYPTATDYYGKFFTEQSSDRDAGEEKNE